MTKVFHRADSSCRQRSKGLHQARWSHRFLLREYDARTTITTSLIAHTMTAVVTRGRRRSIQPRICRGDEKDAAIAVKGRGAHLGVSTSSLVVGDRSLGVTDSILLPSSGRIYLPSIWYAAMSSQTYLQPATRADFIGFSPLITYPFEHMDAAPRACTSYATVIKIRRTRKLLVAITHTRRRSGTVYCFRLSPVAPSHLHVPFVLISFQDLTYRSARLDDNRVEGSCHILPFCLLSHPTHKFQDALSPLSQECVRRRHLRNLLLSHPLECADEAVVITRRMPSPP
ncbi:hypothetical protein IW262DRAFT_3697 [Armillaria fumosa]|nr:hypothetical protein IW262DRAFT_3697 [Armillaria fumosa]